ncbi:MAG: UvrD-helicase domain-containing protein [bacterium]|nr:UvrD-helicase domain-containing protein [bacterium]
MEDTVRYTDQQLSVIRSVSKKIKVRAYAGTGKSSTLVGYAKARPTLRMLYLAYNAAIRAEAKKKFGPNVDCHTGHSLAFSKAAPYVESRGGKGLGNIKNIEVARAMMVAPSIARMSLIALSNFFNNADTEITIAHVKNAVDTKSEPSVETINIIFDLTKDLWRKIQDPKDLAFKMPHDGYLKLFHLANPDLSKYKVILFDEAQDANPVITDIVKSQKHMGTVVVGDRHQSIYRFRGAEDSLDKFDSEETFVLSKSFRFGYGIGKLASLLLNTFKEETVPVEGLSRDKRTGNLNSTEFVVDKDKPYAYLCRTNAMLLDIAVGLVAQNKTLHFIGGPTAYRFDLIMDAFNLWSDKRDLIRDPAMRYFPCWTDLTLFAAESNDPEYKILIKVIDKYTNEIPALIEKAKQSHQEDQESAQVVLCTGHRAKGLEFDQVVLADDFADLMVPPSDDGIDEQEINLLYVATTRAERCIELPLSMQEWLLSIGEPIQKIIIDQAALIAKDNKQRDCMDDRTSDSPDRRSAA